MECTDSNLWCLVFAWLIEHSHDVELAGYPVTKLLQSAFGSSNWLASFAAEHFKELLSFSVGTFGIWKWWAYREKILHERLREFITDSDARLGPTYRDVVRVVTRPDKRTNLRQPAFAYELSQVLRRNRWEPVLAMEGGTHFVERQLTSAIRSIDNRMEIAEQSLNSLRQQRAAAETINAAIAAGRAARTRDQAKADKMHQEALDAYRRVLQLPSHTRDLLAKEGEAFHLLRLGYLDKAAEAYGQLQTLAEDIADARQRAFTKSRALHARALIMQAETQGGRAAAYELISYRLPDTAISIRNQFQPLNGWDAIEHADIAYAGAFLSHRRGFIQVEAEHLSIARECYRRVIHAHSSAPARLSSARRRLRKAANEGIARVERAKNRQDYDLAFLFQQQRQTISDADGERATLNAAEAVAVPGGDRGTQLKHTKQPPQAVSGA